MIFISAVSFCLQQEKIFAEQYDNDQFIILCYHDIPKTVKDDRYAVDQKSFIQQIEYLKTHGYAFVSLEDVLAANKGEKVLPDKAVLLTFDDGYLSYLEFVVPLLELYKIPSMLAIPSIWMENKPADVKQDLMDWQQIKQVSEKKYVDIASHTHSLHTAHIYNPQGNTGWAAVSRKYDKDLSAYETDKEYTDRVYQDLVYSKQVLEEKTGKPIKAVVWPYGQFNDICIEQAEKAGFQAMFTLNDTAPADVRNIELLNRYMVEKNPAADTFAADFKNLFKPRPLIRALQADIDMIYDQDPVQMEKNIDAFIERVYSMKVSAVYLQAFCDDEGNGNIASVYFPNRVLPVKADIFSRIVNQLEIREIPVYAWMPMLSIVLPDKEQNLRLRIRKLENGRVSLSESWYERLSPFNDEAVELLMMLYEDMAKNARISGVIFQDDGYMNDQEDYNEQALDDYLKITQSGIIDFKDLDPAQQDAWTDLKTEKLIQLTNRLKQAVLKYRPNAMFARTLYAAVLDDDYAEQWFAQNYEKSLKNYDYVVIMAYPFMEKAKQPAVWLQSLVHKAQQFPNGIKKTVFKIQTYDWQKDKWIDPRILNKWLRSLVAEGARHIAYYPDDYVQNNPNAEKIRLMMSVEDFPFKRYK